MNKFNEEVEQSLLGCLLLNDKIYDVVSPDFRSEYFYIPVHARIYDAIAKMQDDGRIPTPSLLAKFFENDPDLISAGGAKYLQSLSDGVISVMAAPDYAREIFSLHIARKTEALAKQIDAISNETSGADEKITKIEEIAFSIRAEKAREIKSSETSVNEALQTIEGARKGFNGVLTGLQGIDDLIKGFRPSNLYILAARPSMGKTALAMTMAINAAQEAKKILFISLEMDAAQLQQRAISRFSGITVDAQMGNMDDPGMRNIISAADKIKKLSVHIDDQPSQTVGSILSKARRHARLHGLDCIFIDYLGIIAPDDPRINKVHQIEQVTSGLKRVAKIMKVPVVLLSQLSRALEIRDDKRPMLSDLRDSGAIEQDADVVMFIYRHEYYLGQPPKQGKMKESRYADALADFQKEKENCRGKADIIIAKNRQGRTGTVSLNFDGIRQLFTDTETENGRISSVASFY